MPVRLITPPASEPVTLQQAKDQLRLEGALDDGFVGLLIRAAREYVEQTCGRALVEQVWDLVLDGFVGEDALELGTRGLGLGCLPYIELPKGRVSAVASVKYFDAQNVEQTLSSSVYSADLLSAPPRIHLVDGQSWPTTRTRWDAVTIRFTAGWSVADAAVEPNRLPQPIHQAMLLLISQMYEHRVPVVLEPGSAVDALLAPYRLVRL